MKKIILLACLSLSSLATYAKNSPPEPSSDVAEWKVLPPDLFSQPWTFWRAGRPVADGGSIFVDFKLADKQIVSVVAAHTNYWSKDDLDKSRQPFFVYFGNKMHRFDPGTTEEQAVKKAITAASESAPAKTKEVLKNLLEKIESRKSLFKLRSEQVVPPNGP